MLLAALDLLEPGAVSAPRRPRWAMAVAVAAALLFGVGATLGGVASGSRMVITNGVGSAVAPVTVVGAPVIETAPVDPIEPEPEVAAPVELAPEAVTTRPVLRPGVKGEPAKPAAPSEPVVQDPAAELVDKLLE